MVTAGVYMVARSNALFVLAPNAMKTVAIIGALTAIFAATIGLVQNDIKRVLAYSTVSQLGYMFLALGVGAFAAGVFHVFTHAFFKALLFLGAGSVIHAMSGEQEMQHMGALHGKIKTTFGTMLIATLAISGIPGFAGFFSKDAILWETWSREGGAYRYLWYIAFLTALMTSFYMFRLIYLTFFGKPRMNHEVEHHIHESPKTMTVPLVILAICSVGAGFLGLPHSLGGSNRFEKFLEPVFAKEAVVLQEGGKAAQVAAGEQQVEHTDPLEYMPDVRLGRRGGGRLVAGAASLQECRQRLQGADQGLRSALVQDAVPQVLRGRDLRLGLHRTQESGSCAPGRDGPGRRPVEV